MKFNARKESAILGITASIMFMIGYSILPDARIGPINPFIIMGISLVIVSLLAPWYGQIGKMLHRL